MSTEPKFAVVTPWHNPKQRDAFLEAWGITGAVPDFLYLQQDADKCGCALTKNRGIQRAIDSGAEVIVVLDDDCFPDGAQDYGNSLEKLANLHLAALEPVEVERYRVVTNPQSRGTPYYRRTMKMPVAAAIGFWSHVPDLCAPAQLVRGPLCPMTFDRRPIYGDAFAYCGMNVSFKSKWWPWCSFVDLQRVDDIFAGYLFQKEAYRLGHCFNLGAPLVRHDRQSNVWANLREEQKYLEKNETLWSDILCHPSNDYKELCKLLPKKE